MSITSRGSSSPSWGALFFALLGLIWCGYVAFPTSSPAPCLNSGCAITKDFEIAGISLWWIGGAYFFLLSVLCLRGFWTVAFRLAQIALFLDVLLLLIMLITGPCSQCLVAALFFALTYFCLRRGLAPQPHDAPPRMSLLLPLWLGLFLSNGVNAVDELVPPLTTGPSANQQVRLYYSPSCSACRAALLTMGNAATLLPVVEKPGDEEAILRLNAMLHAGVPMEEALKRCLDPGEAIPQLQPHQKTWFAIGLIKNKAAVLKHGFSAMPLIEINGFSRSLGSYLTPPPLSTEQPAPEQDTLYQEESETAPATAVTQQDNGSANIPPASSDTNAPWDGNDLQQCAQGTTEPCDEEPPL